MAVNVRLYNNEISRLTAAHINAVKKTAEQLRTEVIQAEVMPFDTGYSQNVGMDVNVGNANQGKVTIEHTTPYDARNYFSNDLTFSTAHNRNAKSRWWDEWTTGSNRDRAKQLFGEFFRREAGL